MYVCERYSARFRSDLLGAEDSESRNGPVFFLITDIVNIRDEAMCRNVIGVLGRTFTLFFPSFQDAHIVCSDYSNKQTKRDANYKDNRKIKKRKKEILCTFFFS